MLKIVQVPGLVVLATLSAALICGPPPASANPILGSAQSFAVLGASTVTNTGSTTITGDVGLYPGPSVTGFSSANTVVNGPGSTGLVNGPGLVSGTIYISDATANSGQAGASSAYTTLKDLPSGFSLTGEDLGGLTLTPGVYTFATSAQLTGTLTLDFAGNSDESFVFQIGTTLTTASASAIDVTDVGSDDSIFFEVGSSATLGTTTDFVGNILAEDSITLSTGADILCGRAIALTAAVTMDTNTISDSCSDTGYSGGEVTSTAGGIESGTPAPAAVPEPSTLAIFGGGLLGLLGLAVRQRRRRLPQATYGTIRLSASTTAF